MSDTKVCTPLMASAQVIEQMQERSSVSAIRWSTVKEGSTLVGSEMMFVSKRYTKGGIIENPPHDAQEILQPLGKPD